MFDLTAERLREILHYDPATGVFTWLVSKSGVRADKSYAGCISKPSGYVKIKICGKIYGAHRLACLYMTGRWSDGEIDHRNGVRTDNRFINLRDAPLKANQQNKGRQRNNASGFTGVSWHKHNKKWCANIGAGGCTKYLGAFDTKEEARDAYISAKLTHHEYQPVPREMLKELEC